MSNINNDNLREHLMDNNNYVGLVENGFITPKQGVVMSLDAITGLLKSQTERIEHIKVELDKIGELNKAYG